MQSAGSEQRERLAPVKRRDGLRQLIALHAGFALTGTATVLLGPALPAFSKQWHLADSQTGALFTAQFLGSFVAAVASSAAILRFGLKRCVIGAFVVIAAGFAAAGSVSWPVTMAAVCLYGGGLGLAIPAISLIAAGMDTPKSASSLNLLNFNWCAGAMAAPAITTAILAWSGLSGLFFSLALAAAVVALVLGAAVEDFSALPQSGTAIRPSHDSSTLRLTLLTATLIFLYVGTESSIAGWAPLWASRMGASAHTAAATASCFWAGILLARLLAGAAFRYASPSTVILAGLGLSGIAIALMVAFATLSALVVSAAVCGFGFGTVFPTVVSVFCDATGPQATRWANSVFASGALGGAILPLATGWATSRWGGLRAGLALALCATAAMMVLQFAIRRNLRRMPARNPL